MNQVPTIWGVLAIAPTRDMREIRRAYAQRLKITHPEDDADGFKLLRSAYEHAMRLAAQAMYAEGSAQQATEAPPESPPVDSPAEAQPPPADEEMSAAGALFDSLQASIRNPASGAQPGELKILEALLKSPSLERMDIYQRAEVALAQMLASHMPRTDHLLDTTARYFEWQRREHEGTLLSAAREVLQRLVDLGFLESLEKSNSPRARAHHNLLHKKPTWIQWLQAVLVAHPLETDVLRQLRFEHPQLLAQVPRATVDFWDRLTNRPQPSKALIYTGLIVAGVALFRALALESTQSSGALFLAVAMLPISATIVAFKYFAIDLPIYHLHQRWEGSPPIPIAIGWLPALVLILCAAVGTSGTGWPETCVAMLAALTWAWALVASGPATAYRWGTNLMESRAVRVVCMNGILIFWLALLVDSQLGFTVTTVISFLLTMFASGIGRPLQMQMFRTRLNWRQRAIFAGANAAIVCGFVAWSVAHVSEPAARGWIVAGVVALTLLRRASSKNLALGETWFTAVVVVAGGFIVSVFLTRLILIDMSADIYQGAAMVLRGVLLILGGAVIAMIRELYDALTLKDEFPQYR